MSGLRTSHEMGQIIQSVTDDIAPYKAAKYKVKVLGRGFERFGWELTFGDRNPGLRHWWSIDRAKVDVPGYKEYIRQVANDSVRTVVLWSEEINERAAAKLKEVNYTYWEKDTLRKYMTELPTSSQAYQLYTNVPLH